MKKVNCGRLITSDLIENLKIWYKELNADPFIQFLLLCFKLLIINFFQITISLEFVVNASSTLPLFSK
jgi:hypothetical protein